VGLKAWSGTSLRSTWHREVQKRLVQKYPHLYPFSLKKEVVSCQLTIVCANFRNREELKNALATSRSKLRDLEVRVREIEAGAWNSNGR
jgi:hypothetical protein